MAITTAITNAYKQAILNGIHAAADVYKIALYTSSASLDKTTATYSTTNEVVGTGYTAGGQTLVGFTVNIVSDTAYIDWTTDPSWTSATITARGCMIYNSSKSNAVLAVYDFGADISSTNGTFTAVLPAPGATAVIRVT